MIKVNYEKDTGKILGFYADDINYTSIPEPYIEITYDERLAIYQAPKGKEYKVDLTSLETKEEIIEQTELEKVEVETEEEVDGEIVKKPLLQEKSVIKTKVIKHYKGRFKLDDIVLTKEEQAAKSLLDAENNIPQIKAEIAKLTEDIEQEALGFVRNDYAEKRARKAALINELRVLEGKEPREVKPI